MTDDRSASEDDRSDDVVEDLRLCNPLDTEALPSSHSPEALRTLEQILEEPGLETESTTDPPAASNRGGRAKPPPRPQRG